MFYQFNNIISQLRHLVNEQQLGLARGGVISRSRLPLIMPSKVDKMYWESLWRKSCTSFPHKVFNLVAPTCITLWTQQPQLLDKDHASNYMNIQLQVLFDAQDTWQNRTPAIQYAEQQQICSVPIVQFRIFIFYIHKIIIKNWENYFQNSIVNIIPDTQGVFPVSSQSIYLSQFQYGLHLGSLNLLLTASNQSPSSILQMDRTCHSYLTRGYCSSVPLFRIHQLVTLRRALLIEEEHSSHIHDSSEYACKTIDSLIINEKLLAYFESCLFILIAFRILKMECYSSIQLSTPPSTGYAVKLFYFKENALTSKKQGSRGVESAVMTLSLL